MNLALHRPRGRWLALRLCGAAAVALPTVACAQSWTLQGSTQAKVESNSNPALSSSGDTASTTGSLTASASVTRSTEVAETRGEAELILSPRDGRADGSAPNTLGRLALRHRLSAPRDSWSGSVSLSRDRTLQQQATASDLDVGRTERELGEFGLSWTHRFSERLSSDLQGTRSRTRFDSPQSGSGFQVATTSAGLQWAWTEIASLDTSVSRTEQRLDGSGLRTTIDSLRVGLSQAWTETASTALSVSSSSTTRHFTVRSRFCALPVRFCSGGLVPYSFADNEVQLRGSSWQYSASGNWRATESLSAAARLARTLTPTSQGVSTEDVLSLSASQSWSERLRAGLALDGSRSTSDSSAGRTSATLVSVTLTGSYQFDEHLQLITQLQQRNVTRNTPQSRASSTGISITLQYQAATVPGWR